MKQFQLDLCLPTNELPMHQQPASGSQLPQQPPNCNNLTCEVKNTLQKNPLPVWCDTLW